MKHLSMTMREAIDWWNTIDDGGRNLQGVRALCLIDRFYLLVKVCGRTDMLHPWIYARCREVEQAPEGYIDLWSREHYKSTIITFGGAMQEIFRDPDITICVFSHTKGIASKFLQQIKTEFERNAALISAFPDILYADPYKECNQWSVDAGITVKRSTNPKERTVEASGLVDGQPTSKHYRLRIYDDVVVPESVTTPEQLKKTTDAYSMSQALGADGGRMWFAGTRYHYSDTYQWIMDRGAATPRIYPATTTGEKDGPLVLFSKKRWHDVCINSTESDIACQYMQNPLSGQQGMFDINDIQVYEVRPDSLRIYIVIDPARSKKKDSADTAMIVIGVDYALNKYVLDGFCHKMNLMERWEHMIRLYARWMVQPGIQSVDVGYEAFGAQADLDYFEEQMKLLKRRFEIKELTWPRDTEGSKQDRVQRLVPDIKGHKFYMPYKNPNPEYEGRLTSLQNKMYESGYEYRIAQAIKRLDENGQPYDLGDKLKLQIQFFPYGGKKDAVDAASRIYDMEIKTPTMHSEGYAEPEFV